MALQLKMDPTQIVAGSAKAETALDGVKAAAVQAESAVTKLGKTAPAMAPLAAGADRAAAASGRLAVEAANVQRTGFAAGGGMRMLGQQLSQVAQQGAVTGNYLGALAVQLPDIALGFGSVAIAASIVGTVALPLLINAFGAGKTAAEQMGDANDRLADSIDVLKGISSDFANGSLQTLIDKYGQADTALLQLINRQRDQAVMLAQTAARDAVTALTGEYGNLLAMIDAGGRAGQANAIQLQNTLGLTTQQALALRDAMADAQAATTFDEQAAALVRVDALLAQSKIKGSEFAAAVTNTALAMRQVAFQAEESGDALADNVAQANYAYVTMQNMPGALDAATSSANGLAAAMGGVASAAMKALANFNAMAMGAVRGSLPSLGAGPAGMGSAPPTGGAVGTSPRPGRRGIDFDFSGGASNGGGGGGGAAQADRTREAYDRLMASLDPVVAKTQDMAEATETANKALAAGTITSAEHANAISLIAKEYSTANDAMTALNEAGGNALDGLINGTMDLRDALKDMAKELIFATVKAQLLKTVTGGTASMSIGGLLMQGITGGFGVPMLDGGGSIPMGSTAMVGERGPELVRATSNGAVVTSRVDTARQSGGAMHVTVGVSVDDEGNLKAYVKKMSQAAAQSGAGQAIQAVKRSLPTWNSQLQSEGSLA